MTSTRTRTLLLTLVLTAVAFLVGSATAQDPPEGGVFGEVVDVELVNVEVWVTDNKGRPVSGLTREDFEVREDGDPVEVSYFSEIQGAFTRRGPQIRQLEELAEEPAEPEAAAESEAGHLVIYFDDLHIEPRSRKRLVEDLRAFLAAEDVPPERVLILRQDENLTTEAPFGSDWQKLDQTLERLADAEAENARSFFDKSQSLQRLQELWDLAQPPASMPSQAGAGPDPCQMFMPRAFNEIRLYASTSQNRIVTTLNHLADTASFLAGVPGTKTLLYLSDALETAPGMGLRAYVLARCPTGTDEEKDLQTPVNLNEAFRDLTRHANANRVTFYALQASTLRSGTMDTASSAFTDVRVKSSATLAIRSENRSGLNLLAGETGGRTITNANDFSGHLDTIAEEMSNYYSLAYTPTHGGDGGQHKITVQVKEGKLQVRHRKGYRDKSPDERMAERVQTALFVGRISNPLEVRLGVGNLEAAAKKKHFRVPLHVRVPSDKLVFLPTAEGSKSRVKVQIATRGAKQRKVALRGRVYEPAEPAQPGLLDLVFDLELEEGVQLLAVGLRDETTREASYVATAIEIRDPGAGM